MNLRQVTLIASCLFVLSMSALFCTSAPSAATTNVVAPFLEDGVGGRSVAMGENYTAVAQGPFGHLYNPAGLAKAPSLSLGFQHESLGVLVAQEVLGGCFNVGSGGIGFLLSYYNYGEIEARLDTGELSGETIKPSDLLLNAGYGMQLAPQWQAGVNLGFFRVGLGEVVFNGVVFDLGGIWTPIQDWTFGLVLKNLGGLAKGYQIPMSLRLGGACQLFAERLLLDLDVDVSLAGSTTDVGLGVEYRAWDWLALRTGFQLPVAGGEAQEGLVLGAGFNVGHFGIDVSILGRGDLGGEASVGLVYNLGASRTKSIIKKEKVKAPPAQKEETKTISHVSPSGVSQAEYHYKAGQEYEKYKQTIDAIVEYKAALKINPKYKKAQKALIAAKAKARSQMEKKESVASSEKSSPQSPSIQKMIRKYYNKGMRAYKEKDYATAIKQLQLVLELTTQHHQATELLDKAKQALNREKSILRKQAALARDEGDLASEVVAYQKMLDLDPGDKKTKTKLKVAKKKIPKEVDRLYKQGIDNYARSKYRKSLASFENLLKLQPNHVKAKDAVRNIKEKLIQTGQ
jgi:hypothetical protein